MKSFRHGSKFLELSLLLSQVWPCFALAATFGDYGTERLQSDVNGLTVRIPSFFLTACHPIQRANMTSQLIASPAACQLVFNPAWPPFDPRDSVISGGRIESDGGLTPYAPVTIPTQNNLHTLAAIQLGLWQQTCRL
jgi:hypothetical protein